MSVSRGFLRPLKLDGVDLGKWILGQCISVPDGCMLWPWTVNSDGYPQISYKGAIVRGNRLIWQLLKGEIPDGLGVLHRCDTPPCLRIEHLFLGTNAENMQDRLAKRRYRFGEQRLDVKLMSQHVAEIRELYAAGGLSQHEIGKHYGVCDQHVSRIVNRHKRRHDGNALAAAIAKIGVAEEAWP